MDVHGKAMDTHAQLYMLTKIHQHGLFLDQMVYWSERSQWIKVIYRPHKNSSLWIFFQLEPV